MSRLTGRQVEEAGRRSAAPKGVRSPDRDGEAKINWSSNCFACDSGPETAVAAVDDVQCIVPVNGLS